MISNSVPSLRILLSSIVLSLLFVSCRQGADKDVLTYTVTRKNFENTIRIAGFVDPVNVTSVICPMSPYIDGIVEWLVEEGTLVEEGDILCVLDYPALETNYEQMLTGLEGAKTSMNRMVADLNTQYAMLEAQVKNTEAESNLAQMDSLEMMYLSPNQKKIREKQLEIAEINKVRYEKKLEALKVIQSSEIRRREIELRQYTERVKTAEEGLEKLTIRAPKAGLVVLANASMTGEKLKLGDNVWSNRPIAMLPELGSMKVKMLASETDYRQIDLGDSIVYRFDAMPGNAGFGKIGNRAYVGQPLSRGSQVKYFELEGTIDSVAVMPEPGFTAEATIMLEEVKDVLVVPQVAVFEVDSMKVVFVQRARGYEMRQVKTGPASLKEAVVEEGLSEGEVIALMRPAERAVRRTALLPAADSTSVETTLPDSLDIVPAPEGPPQGNHMPPPRI